MKIRVQNLLARVGSLSLLCLVSTFSSWGFTLYNHNLYTAGMYSSSLYKAGSPYRTYPPAADFDSPPDADFSDCINNPTDHWAWPVTSGQVVITYAFDSSFDTLFPNDPSDEAAVEAQIVVAMSQWSNAVYGKYGILNSGGTVQYDSYARLNPLSLTVPSPQSGPSTQTIPPFMDVRSATVHELGHILGFGHCDQGATANPVANFAYYYNGSRGYGPLLGTLVPYASAHEAPWLPSAEDKVGVFDNPYFYNGMLSTFSPGMFGQEVMSQYSAAGAGGTAIFGRLPGEIYHTLSWDELDGYAFIYGTTPLVFEPAANEADANLVFYGQVGPLTDLVTGGPDPGAVCQGIPMSIGSTNAASQFAAGNAANCINNATITFANQALVLINGTQTEVPIGFETAGFNFDFTTPTTPPAPGITGVTLTIAGTDNTDLVGGPDSTPGDPTFDNFAWWQVDYSVSSADAPNYVFNPGVAIYLGDPIIGSASNKDSISVAWSGATDPIPAGTPIHVGVTPDVWDWTDYPIKATTYYSDSSSTQMAVTPVDFWGSTQLYGTVADASASSQRISASCLTTVAALPTPGASGLAVTSPMDGTAVYNLQIADVTGMGLTLSDLNGITLAQLQQSNQVIAVTNFGTNILNSGQQFVVILQGSTNYLPQDIATNGHYRLLLNQSNLVNRELFAVVTSSNLGVVVHNYSLLNAPPVTATPTAPCGTAYIGNSLTVTNGAPDGGAPLVILGEYSPAGPLPSSSVTLPAGTVQDVKFYGQGYDFTLYALSRVGPGPHSNEQTFKVVASQSFSGNITNEGVQTVAVSGFSVNAGDLLAFAGQGPYYPQNDNDAYNSDATYQDPSNPNSSTATPPGGPGTVFSVGLYPDTNATYGYISDAFGNQGRTYGIGVDVALPCTNGLPLISTKVGGSHVLTWPSGAILQSAPTLQGPWTDLPGAPSPYTIPASAPTSFYRFKIVQQ